MKNYEKKQTLLIDSCYEPVKMIHWEQAITKVYTGKAKVIQQYSHIVWRNKHNPDESICKPRIITEYGLNKHRVVSKGKVKRVSNESLLQRDDHQCQYCGRTLNLKTMTRDHVFPKHKGGRAHSDNVVCACIKCNQKKGGRTPEEAGMPLLKPLKKLTLFFISKKMKEIYDSYFVKGLATV